MTQTSLIENRDDTSPLQASLDPPATCAENPSDALISIIIPTIGRSTELDTLLSSIAKSIYPEYEVVVVDQNQTEMVDQVLLPYMNLFPIRHVKVHFTGAARARNHGCAYARGRYLFFPDDDSELYPNTLSLSIKSLEMAHADVLFGKCIDRALKDSAGIFSKHSSYLSLKCYKNMFIETTLFIRKSTFSRFYFDESFGVGTFYGAEEVYDLVLRMLHNNVPIYYTPEVKVYHPPKVINHVDSSEIRRVFSYRCGFAHLCVKHKLYGKYLSRLLKVILYIPYTMIFSRMKTRYYLSELMGLLAGVIVR